MRDRLRLPRFQRLVALGGLALGLGSAACGPNDAAWVGGSSPSSTTPLRLVERLQCPDTLGSLTRRGSAQEGGDRCVYGGPRGSEVTLSLARMDMGDLDALLPEFERRVVADMPHAVSRLDQSEPPLPPAPPPIPAVPSPDVASVRLPGLRIESRGDQSRIEVGGIRIQSNETSGSVSIGSDDRTIAVRSQDDATEVRTRAPGSATRVTYLVTDGVASPTGWRLAGFEARGPVGGPIVVAFVRAKDPADTAVFDDAKSLVTLNVGD